MPTSREFTNHQENQDDFRKYYNMLLKVPSASRTGKVFGELEGAVITLTQQMISWNAMGFKARVGVRHTGMGGWGMDIGTACQAEGTRRTEQKLGVIREIRTHRCLSGWVEASPRRSPSPISHAAARMVPKRQIWSLNNSALNPFYGSPWLGCKKCSLDERALWIHAVLCLAQCRLGFCGNTLLSRVGQRAKWFVLNSIPPPNMDHLEETSEEEL